MASNSTTERLILDQGFEEIWAALTSAIELVTLAVALFGVGGNFLCYLTAKQLPECNNTHLMRWLAVWDTIAALTDGVDLACRHFGFFIKNITLASV